MNVLVWDVTCLDTLAPSHSALAVRDTGAVAADAEYKKIEKVLTPIDLTLLHPCGGGNVGGIWERGV